MSASKKVQIILAMSLDISVKQPTMFIRVLDLESLNFKGEPQLTVMRRLLSFIFVINGPNLFKRAFDSDRPNSIVGSRYCNEDVYHVDKDMVLTVATSEKVNSYSLSMTLTTVSLTLLVAAVFVFINFIVFRSTDLVALSACTSGTTPSLLSDTTLTNTSGEVIGECDLGYRFFIWPLPSIYHAQVWSYYNEYHTAWGQWTGPNISTPTIFRGDQTNLQYSSEAVIALSLQLHPCRTYNPEESDFFMLLPYQFAMVWFGEHTGGYASHFQTALIRLSDALDHPADTAVLDTFFAYLDQEHKMDQLRLANLTRDFPDLLPAVLNGTLQLTPHHLSYMFPDRTRPADPPTPMPIMLPPLNAPPPSIYRQYWNRHSLCDTVVNAARPPVDWDSARHWSRTGAAYQNPIFLTQELLDRPLHQSRYQLRKNVAIPYPTWSILDDDNALLWAQHQAVHQRLGLSHYELLRKPITSDAEKSMMNEYSTWLAAHGVIELAHQLERPYLAVFTGAFVHGSRHQLYKAFEEQKQLVFNDTPFTEITTVVNHRWGVNNHILFGYLQAKFCFSVPGDTASTKRVFDVIAAGCIPVIISDQWVLPFPSLPWQQFAIRFDEGLLANNSQLIFETLRSMSPQRVWRFQRALNVYRKHFFYPAHRQSFRPRYGDAIDTLLRELQYKQIYAKTCEMTTHTVMF